MSLLGTGADAGLRERNGTNGGARAELALRDVVAALPSDTLLLAPDSRRFTILDACDAYLTATHTFRWSSGTERRS